MLIPEEQKFANLIKGLNELLARQDRLEARLARLEQNRVSEPVVDRIPIEILPQPIEPKQEPQLPLDLPFAKAKTQPNSEVPADELPQLESRVGLTILNRIGVVTLVLGVAFFFKWAVDNNWIGPSGRVLLGLLAGFATLALADRLWHKGQQVFAQGITGAGIAIVYLSFYAAFDLYHLIPQVLAFVMLLATTAMATSLALRYNSIAIAILGFFGAYIIPLLLSNGEDHPWFLLSYLLLLNFAATELATRRGWRILEGLSFSAATLIFGAWLIDHGNKGNDRLPATVGALALCGQLSRTSFPYFFLIGHLLTALSIGYIWSAVPMVFFPFSIFVLAGGLAFAHFRKFPDVVPAVFAGFWTSVWWINRGPSSCLLVATVGFLLFHAWWWWRLQRNERVTGGGLAVFALNGVLYYALAYTILEHDYHHWLGLLAVAVAGAYLSFGMLLHRRTKTLDTDIFVLGLGISVAFLTLAIPIQLSGFSITIAWSIQAAALTWIGVRLNKLGAVISALVVFALAFLRVAAFDLDIYHDPHTYALLFNARFMVFAVLAICLLLSAYWVSKIDNKLPLVHYVSGHLVLLAGLTLEVLGWADRSAQPQNLLSVRTVATTVLFAFYAVILVSIGVVRRSVENRIFGLALTAIVIVKLYVFDVWQLGRIYQIIAFVILGILLLSTSFLYSRFKGIIDEWRKDEKTPV